MSYEGFPTYVRASDRRRKTEKRVTALAKKGATLRPVAIAGRTIARTFWGRAWCDNLESYSDYANRLPRGRTYLRNGSVCDLQVAAGRVKAIVSGTSMYRVEVAIAPIAETRWHTVRQACAGGIDSLVELLQGRLSAKVLHILTDRTTGLFPAPREMTMSCSCPDWAGMCKHVAASLYGVGARLDEEPELLFVLRGVDPLELFDAAGSVTLEVAAPQLETDDLSAIFGIEIDTAAAPDATRTAERKKTGARKDRSK